jgi:hypothetical protein
MFCKIALYVRTGLVIGEGSEWERIKISPKRTQAILAKSIPTSDTNLAKST